MTAVVKLTAEGRVRIPDTEAGATFIVEKFTNTVDTAGLVAHVRDYRWKVVGQEAPYKIWSLSPHHYEIIEGVLDLGELLDTQARLQARMGHPTGDGEAGCKENLLQLIMETSEAMRELNFKPWKRVQIQVDREALATELTDILQFWANAALAMSITPAQLSQALRAKWVVNHQRITEGSAVEAQS